MSGNAAAKPRRPTGRALVRQVLKQPDAELRYWSIALVPIGARAVLEAVADLVARSEQPGVYRPDLDLGADSLASWVAIKLRAVGAEREIAGHLAALTRARLMLVAEDGAISLPLPPPPAPLAEGEVPRVGRSPGRRKEWMTEAQWAEHCAAHHDIWEAQKRMDAIRPPQTAMLLSIPGGRAGASADIPAHISQRDIKPDIGGDIGGDIEAAGRTKSASSRAAVVVEDRIDIQPETTTTTARATGDIGADIPAADIRSDIEAADIRDADIPALQPSGAADRYAASIVRGLSLPASKAGGVAHLVQSWLQRWTRADALLPDVIEECIRQHERQRQAGKKGVASANYIGRVLEEALRGDAEHARLSAVPAAAPATAAPPSAIEDPRLQQHPGWMAAPPHLQRGVLDCLDTIGASLPASELRRRLDAKRTYSRVVFDLVGRVHPEIYELVGEEPPDQGYADPVSRERAVG